MPSWQPHASHKLNLRQNASAVGNGTAVTPYTIAAKKEPLIYSNPNQSWK